MADTPRELILQGIPVSPGIARAPAHFVGRSFDAPPMWRIPDSEVARERERFSQALAETHAQISKLQDKLSGEIGPGEAGIFDAHLLVLEDRMINDEVLRLVQDDRFNIEYAYFKVVSRYLESIRKIEDPYLRERAVDIQDVGSRVIKNLRGHAPTSGADEADPKRKHVLVAHDITPSDTAAMDRELVSGFATEVGSVTSHTAIIARSLGIPAVVGLHGLGAQVRGGMPMLIDGYAGYVIAYPSEETLARYRKLERDKGVLQEKLLDQCQRDAETRDGHRLTLSANIEFAYEAKLTKERGATGIGLYRTEFFFANRAKFPGEDRQAANYGRVARGAAPHSVIIRTSDVGGDKVHPAEFLVDPEPNPFLGWRGIRVSLKEEAIFKTQLRAILRASAEGKVGIMYPMIASLGELRSANQMLEACKAELKAEGIAFDDNLEVGAMMEVPSAAIIAPALAKEVDFFSIGTNDLVQYTLAVDRVNERVADLYQPGHPAIAHLIHQIVAAGHAESIWVGVCGEMAGDLRYLPLLIGLGVDELSVGASQLPAIKYAIRSLSRDACDALASDVLTHCSDAADTDARCRAVAEEHYAELL